MEGEEGIYAVMEEESDQYILPMQMEKLSLENKPTEIEDVNLGKNPTEMKDVNLESKPTEKKDDNLENKPTEKKDDNLESKPSEMEDVNLENKPTEKKDGNLESNPSNLRCILVKSQNKIILLPFVRKSPSSNAPVNPKNKGANVSGIPFNNGRFGIVFTKKPLDSKNIAINPKNKGASGSSISSGNKKKLGLIIAKNVPASATLASRISAGNLKKCIINTNKMFDTETTIKLNSENTSVGNITSLSKIGNIKVKALKRNDVSRPFVCHICKNDFVSRALLELHSIKHTTKQANVNKVCDKTSISNDIYKLQLLIKLQQALVRSSVKESLERIVRLNRLLAMSKAKSVCETYSLDSEKENKLFKLIYLKLMRGNLFPKAVIKPSVDPKT